MKPNTVYPSLSSFSCDRCGRCCYNVPLSPRELKFFQNALMKKKRWNSKSIKYFPEVKLYLFQGQCPFLKLLKGETACEIYDNRPKGCRDHPVDGYCQKILRYFDSAYSLWEYRGVEYSDTITLSMPT